MFWARICIKELLHCKKYYLLFLKSLDPKISRLILGKCSSSIYTIHSQINFFFQNFNQQPLSSRQEDVARTIIESQQLMLDYNATSGTPPIIPVLKKIRKYVSETVRNGEKIIVYPKICWTIVEETRRSCNRYYKRLWHLLIILYSTVSIIIAIEIYKNINTR